MLVTFLRHGQSEHNAGLTPYLDSGLTPLGKLQASAAAKRFSLEGFDESNTVAFVSPLMRTLQTLEPSATSLLFPSIVFTEIREYFSARNDGYLCFEGLSSQAIGEQFPWATIGAHIGPSDTWWPNVQEDDLQLYDRASSVRDQLLAAYLGTDKQLLIVSHADPIGRMIESFLRVPANLDGCPWSANCGVTRIEVLDYNSPGRLILLNDLSHLEVESLVTPK